MKLEKIELMTGWNKYFGLMGKKETSKPIMFKLPFPENRAIHSLFCPTFMAYWYLGKDKIGEELITTGRFTINPPGKWDTLIEVPIAHIELRGENDE